MVPEPPLSPPRPGRRGGWQDPSPPVSHPGRCLLDGQRGRSRFLPPRGDGSLRFQLDTLLFPNASGSQVGAGGLQGRGVTPGVAVGDGWRATVRVAGGCLSPSQIYLRCHLKAVAEGTGGTLGKACSYDAAAAAWSSPDGADCSCCGSPAGCGRRRRQLAGTGGRRTPWVGPVSPAGGPCAHRCLTGFSLQGSWGKPASSSVPWGCSRRCPARPRPCSCPRRWSRVRRRLVTPRCPSCGARRGTRVSARCPRCWGGGWWSVPPSPCCLSPQGRLSPSLAPRWPRWPCAPSSSPWLQPAATARCDGTGRGVPGQLRGSPVLWPWLPARPPGLPLLLQPPPGHEPLCFINKPVAEMAVPSVGGGCRDPRVLGGGVGGDVACPQ